MNSPHYKRFPAYGKKLMELRLAGELPRQVYAVFDWNLGRAFPRIVVTGEIPAADLDLRFLAGLDVEIAYRAKDASRVPELAQAILKVNPRICNAFAVDIPLHTILKNLNGRIFL